MKTYKKLLSELNEVRAAQKTKFVSVAQYLQHGKETAIKKATILNQIEKSNFKN